MANATPAPLVNGSHGNVTLQELSGTGLVLKPGTDTAIQIFDFEMPEGATQGPDIWYMVRLDVSVTFSSAMPKGSVLISESVNGHSSAQVEFFPEEDKNGNREVSWSSADLIRGSYGGRTRGRTARMTATNYLIPEAVKGGLNQLGFQAKALGGADVAKVEIAPSSSVYATPLGWVELDVEAHFEERLRVGEEGQLEVEVSNASLRPARSVAVILQPLSSDLFLDGPIGVAIKDLKGTETRNFTVGRTKPGELRVAVLVADASSGEAAKVVVNEKVMAGDGGLTNPWRLALALTLLGLLAGAMTMQRRREAGS